MSSAYVLALFVGVPAVLFAGIALLVLALAGPSKPSGGSPALRPGRPLRNNGAAQLDAALDRPGAPAPQTDDVAPPGAPDDLPAGPPSVSGPATTS